MSAWLIDTVLYTGVLIALVLVLRRPLGKFFGPQLAYALWALPFLRLLLPPIVLPASFAPEPTPALVAPVTEWAPVAADLPVETVADTVTVTATAALPAATIAAPAPPAWEWADLIAPAVSLWAGVALAFLLFRVVTYHRMRGELLKGARPVGEIGRIRLVETPALAAPVAFGVLDKVIALPPLFMAQHDVAARDLAIAHELAHHKGHDLLANFAAQALLALHWFNPLAWYGWRAMRRDQEAACDARVLAGRGREERLRYAALIAGIATGPRSIAFKGALAAPMACPVLGERSIVHRLRSLSMSELSRRRRWVGRSLVGASALALPLTASISYAAASAQPASPAPRAAELAPAVPEIPQLDDADNPFQTVVTRVGPDGKHTVRDLTARVPQGPHGEPYWPNFSWPSNPDDPEFQAEMEEFQREMEQFREEWAENQDWEKFGEQWAKWGEQYGKHWEEWGRQWGEQQRAQSLALAERQREQAERQREQALARAERQREQAARQREQALARAERQREQALARAEQQREQAQRQREQAQAWAEAARNTPVVVRSCDENERSRTTTSDGRPRVVVCPTDMRQIASSNLRYARESIARSREMSEEVRREVLEDLDEEIERLEREND